LLRALFLFTLVFGVPDEFTVFLTLFKQLPAFTIQSFNLTFQLSHPLTGFYEVSHRC
jgi:hypothetical protein